jgi:aminotransferase in exopolysaccharide biosynthesis|tara:strand:- start:5543 stop:6724 length:1182 start_codon:yes stop_codon:yes gene_type:complete
MISLHEPLLAGNERKYIKHCLDQGWVSSAGKYVDIFEKKIAKYTGAKYAIACINGTAALQISLKLVGVKKGDEVIVPSMTFIAPVNAINYNGAKPIFMDCDEYYTIDVNKTIDFINKETHTIKKKISGNDLTITVNNKTKNRITAIIIVHVFGNAARLNKLVDLCRKKNIALIEDAAESIGTFYTSNKFKKKHTGTVGVIGCLSFNGNKIITSGGGGMMLTNSRKIAKKAKYLTTQAKDDPIYSVHDEVGYNFRLTNILAALGLAQLESLSKYIKKKKIIHERYKKKINKIKYLSISNVSHYATCNYWLNILEINKNSSKKKLSKIIKYLCKNGIEVRPLWYPNHLQKKYKNCQTYKLNNINKIYLNRLCLPSSPQLTKSQQDFICKKLKVFF